MRRACFLLAVAALIPTAACSVRADFKIVVATRYLQAEGTSHAHLFLYREDGKLLRRLTSSDEGQDTDPIFAEDGESIVFTRLLKGDAREFWTVEPSGRGLQKLAVAPDWYSTAKSSPWFTSDEAVASSVASDHEGAASAPAVFRTPDDSAEIILKTDPADEDDQTNGEGHGKHYLLRDLKAGQETEMGKLPGFVGLVDIMHPKDAPAQPFLFQGKLRVAFFELHLNSTDGSTVFALDLNTSRLVRLSANWAAPFPLPGEAAFLTRTENRYLPIPRSTKTANCSYLERWDASLTKVRYAEPNSAAICYGASMFRPDKAPRVIVTRTDAE